MHKIQRHLNSFTWGSNPPQPGGSNPTVSSDLEVRGHGCLKRPASTSASSNSSGANREKPKAIMSRIIGVTLLLIILIGSFWDSTASPAGYPLTRMEIRKCRCTHMSSGKIKCPFPSLPLNDREIRCLCSIKNPNKSRWVQELCRRRFPLFQIQPILM